MSYVTVSRTCINCGGATAVMLTSNEPDQKVIRENEVAVGNNTCITTFTVKVELDGDSTIFERLGE